MKKAILLVFLSFSFFAVQAQDNLPVIAFEETSYNFQEINQGDVVEHTFKFTNTGSSPLVITKVNTTCGCTAPSWPRQPIPAGESAEIQVKFNSRGKMGRQNKVITVISNASNSTERVSLVGNVVVPEQSAQ